MDDVWTGLLMDGTINVSMDGWIDGSMNGTLNY